MSFFQLFVTFALMALLALKGPALIIWFGHFIQFLKWKLKDIKRSVKLKKSGVRPFSPYGLKMFCGRQGSGKTVGMVWYLDQIRKKYPKCHIYTNFDYAYQTKPLESLLDLLNLRNGEDGVVFALDEIQNEFSSAVSKDFPESLLSEITQQRKQKVCILASSQVFTRVAKPLREQCYEVIECRTFFGRWTRLKSYDGDDYCSIIDSYNAEKKFKLPKKWVQSFIQTDDLRDSYDTYAKVLRLSRQGFAPKLPDAK